MVAASKLRRAQAAAEAARPYAERMDKVLGNIAAAVAGLGSAPPLLAGTGSDQVHLLRRLHRRARPVRRRSTPRSCGSRASTPIALIAEGKEVKFFCVGRKGYEQLRRQFEKQIIEHVELRARAHARLRAMPKTIAEKIVRALRARASSTSARCSSRASSR